MTMTRAEKTSHGAQLDSARTYGLTTTVFASPTLRAMCREQGRKYFMTAAEYATYRMGRRHIAETATREDWAQIRISRRRRTRKA